MWGCLWCQALAHAPCVASLTGSRSHSKGGLCNCGGAHAYAAPNQPSPHLIIPNLKREFNASKINFNKL